MENVRALAVLTFWFGDLPQKDAATQAKLGDERLSFWFGKDEANDAAIRQQFGDDVEKALCGAYDSWSQTARGRMALILLLDQLTRNIYRDTPRAFLGDALALPLALEGLAQGHDGALSFIERRFFYLPLEHSEDLQTQELSLRTFAALVEQSPAALREASQNAHDYALAHTAIIRRFGRFPHRNQVLGRPSTAEELAFLEQPGSSF